MTTRVVYLKGEIMTKGRIAATLLALTLAATACGSSKKTVTAGATTVAPAASTAAAATTAAPAATTAVAAAGGTCSAKIGFMGPFTGDAASIGQEQLNWGKLGLADYNKANGTDFAFVETDTKLDPAEATTGAQKLVSDNSVVAILGPAGSQEVEAVGPAMPAWFRTTTRKVLRWPSSSPKRSQPRRCSSSMIRPRTPPVWPIPPLLRSRR
jgi:ABC-type branched-subunit amino acid transport system substrate-binding protein